MQIIEKLVRKVIPYPYHFYFGRWRRAKAPKAARRDIVHFHLADDAYFEVFWKVLGHGQGPAVSLYIASEEVLKFDCYGDGSGHYHTQLLKPGACSTVLMLPERTVAAQIDRAIFEMTDNLAWYLERHPLKAVRQFKVERQHLNRVLAQVKAQLLLYQARVPVGVES